MYACKMIVKDVLIWGLYHDGGWTNSGLQDQFRDDKTNQSDPALLGPWSWSSNFYVNLILSRVNGARARESVTSLITCLETVIHFISYFIFHNLQLNSDPCFVFRTRLHLLSSLTVTFFMIYLLISFSFELTNPLQFLHEHKFGKPWLM